MSSGIVLTSAIRQNLLTLQSTTEMQGKIQERLSTGKKVNSALDNPTNFFTAAGLNRRATDLSALLDGMANGIKTLEAADNAMKAITRTVETMRAYVQQARQDKSFKGESFSIASGATGNISLTGGAVTGTVNIATNITGVAATAGTVMGGSDFTDIDLSNNADNELTFDVVLTGTTNATRSITIDRTADGNADDIIDIDEAVTEISAQLLAAGGGVTVAKGAGADANKLVFTTGATGATQTVTIDNIAVGGTGVIATAADLGFTDGDTDAGSDAVVARARTVDEMVAAIAADSTLTGKIKASNDGGKLRIDNLSTEALTIAGINGTTGEIQGTAGTANKVVGGNEIRKNLIAQFNELRGQLDKLSNDASFNGVNLLKADKLKVTFNEIGTSNIEIQAKDSSNAVRGIDTSPTSLDIVAATAAEFSDDALLESRLQKLGEALTVIQTQSGSFGSSLSIVQVRQEFTKSMINTLEVGADNLTLADANEEGANLLALNTRQQLSQTALSLAAQAQQAVLRLFG